MLDFNVTETRGGHELQILVKDEFRQWSKWAVLHTGDQQIYGHKEHRSRRFQYQGKFNAKNNLNESICCLYSLELSSILI